MNIITYGTGRAGAYNHDRFFRNATLIGKGVLDGFAMVYLGGCPEAFPSKDSHIVVEVYDTPDADASNMRCIGLRAGYTEKEVECCGVKATIFFNKTPRSKNIIQGGDYIQYLFSRK